ncbi:MAG: SGNH/GDSL hydrolase family protein [Chthoniobacterales bacterium]
MAAHRKKLEIEDIDKNFKSARPSQENLVWVDAFDRRFALRGLAWLGENRRQKSFRRLPDRAADRLSEGVQNLSYCPSSAFLSFKTDASRIVSRITLDSCRPMLHMPLTGNAGGELYFKNENLWQPVATAVPQAGELITIAELISNLPKKEREYRFYLPLYSHLAKVELAFDRAAKLAPLPAAKNTRRLFFYGTSITQGGCANTAGSDFVSIVGRNLDAEVINFGFSGNGRGEPEVAELIREIDAEIFILDHAGNCGGRNFPKTLPKFIKILREKHPVTPIVIASCPPTDRLLWGSEEREVRDGLRDTCIETYVRLKKRGDKNLYFIDGDGLLPPGISGAYVDGVHPTSYGFKLMADGFTAHLAAIRSRY